MKKTNNRDTYLFGFIILLFILVHGWINVRKFFIFHPSCLGIDQFSHMFWKLLKTGKCVIYSIPDALPVGIICAFMTTTTYILLPISLLGPFPANLLFANTVLVASAAIPLFLLAKLKFSNKIIPLAIVLSFFLHPTLGLAATTGFHPLSLALVFLLWSFYFLERRNKAWFLFFAMLANMTKPHIALSNIILGCVLFFRKQDKTLVQYAKYLIFLSAGWFLISICVVKAALFFSNQQLIFPAVSLHKYQSLEQLLQQIIGQPEMIFNNIFLNSKFHLLLYGIFLPVGFVCFLSWPLMLALVPSFFYLSFFPESTEAFNVLAITYYAFICGLRVVLKHFKKFRLIALLIILFGLWGRIFIVPVFEGPDFTGGIPLSKNFSISSFNINAHHRIGLKLIDTIPRDSSCLVTPVMLVGHLYDINRIGIFTKPERDLKKEKWEYVLIDFKNLKYSGTDPVEVIGRRDQLLRDKVYEQVFREDGWVLLKKNISAK